MRKYLMTGVVAIALAAAFTSCSKSTDVYEEGRKERDQQAQAEQKVVQSYEEAFVAAFGQPAANQDWGLAKYGTPKNAGVRTFTRAISDYASYKGTWSAEYKFPSDADNSKFLTEVPGDIEKIAANGEARGGTYFIDNTTTKVNMNTNAGVIYVKGDVDLSADNCFEVTQNTEIYIPSGATLKLGEKDANKLKAIIYIAVTGKLETANRLKMDNTSKVYNHGTIKVGAFEVNNTSFLYNVGTLESTGLVYVANSNSSIVNDGTINSGDVEVAGSGHVQNNAEWTSTGTTTVNSNSATWVNNGHWTTEYYKYTAGSENVINNCFLEVKEDFDINLGDGGGTKGFKIDAGGGVVTKNFNGGKGNNGTSGPYRIIMGSKAVFKVTGTATLDAGNKGTWSGGPKYGYGFFGPDNGDYAVFQAKNIVRGRDHQQGEVTYGGNLYVSAETHFTNDDPYNQSIYYDAPFTLANIYASGDDMNFSKGAPDITIQKTPCNPGFTGNGITYQGRIMGEDLTAESDNDFDFNDVVFDWAISKDGKTAYIKLLAAGGTLPLKIGTAVGEGEEVHSLFNVSQSTMVNTGVGTSGITKDPVEFTLSGNFTTAADIIVSVDKSSKGTAGYVQMPSKIGTAPCLLYVPLETKWVDEYVNISKAYTWFEDYVGGADDQWTSAPVAKYVDLDLSNND